MPTPHNHQFTIKPLDDTLPQPYNPSIPKYRQHARHHENKQTLKFVECKITPGIQIWGYGSVIYHKCLCGEELSYDSPGVKIHWHKYEITVPVVRVRNFDAWYKAMQEKVENNRETYRVSDWSEKT